MFLWQAHVSFCHWRSRYICFRTRSCVSLAMVSVAESNRAFMASDVRPTPTEKLRAANTAFAQQYPGDRDGRQPVHTVYGGAQLFRSDTAVKLAAHARQALEQYAPDARTLGRALGFSNSDPDLLDAVHARVADKLQREAVEDFRIDFEDGYGNRPDREEDGHARSVAGEVARGFREGTLPPFIGLRIKPVSAELYARSIRTLELFLTELVTATGGELPPNFVITLPKLTSPAHAAFFADVLDGLEARLGLAFGALVFEFMVELPQLIIDGTGRVVLPSVVDAARGRAIGAHFGTYDYTAALTITAAEQRMRHPACDFARHMMQVTLAGRGIWLSDGSTAILPVPPHRAAEGAALDARQQQENEAVVHRAWRLHFDDVRDSLARGFYQGWDLHPAQLVTRYAALYSFFLSGLDAASERLRNFIERAAQATLVGDVFDDAATGQALLNYFLRAINSGAVSEEETVTRTGLTLDELQSRSFVKILRGRRG
jgi:citrate lyase beta subunit